MNRKSIIVSLKSFRLTSQEKSLFSRLKFWGDDENEKLLYQLSLKSVGDKTEIFLLKEDGEVEVEENAANIFNTLQSLYSNLKI